MSGHRPDKHAGTWYPGKCTELTDTLDSFMKLVKPIPELDYLPEVPRCRAIISPHAGLFYSGSTAAWAYSVIPIDKVKRIFVLGPTHNVAFSGVALTTFSAYDTPMGPINIDVEVVDNLRKTGLFHDFSKGQDTEEHSIEMQLPFIRRLIERRNVPIVPLYVSHLTFSQFEYISAALAPYWEDEGNFFIISSDFCHWGRRFRYTQYYPHAPDMENPVPPIPKSNINHGESTATAPLTLLPFSSDVEGVPIWKSIQYMDHEGIEILRRVTSGNADWKAYLERTKNTVCGREPLSLFNWLMYRVYKDAPYHKKPEFTFVRYAQNEQCKTAEDSSVSYVSAVLHFPNDFPQ